MIVSSLVYARPIFINGMPGSDFDAGDAVVVDAEGNTVVAGHLQTTANTAALTIMKFGADRSEIWRRVLGDIPAGFLNDAADRTLALDHNGHVVVVGSMVRPGTGTDFFVAKLDKETGAPLWQPVRIRGTDNSDNRATAVAVDAENHIIAVGSLGDANANNVFLAVKVDSETGAEIWRRSLPGSPVFPLDQAHAVAVMRNNDVAVAGLLSGHFGVVRLHAATGMVQPGWPQMVIGTLNSTDSALSVAVGPDDHIVAAGITANRFTFSDFTVCKFDGVTGSRFWCTAINGAGGFFDAARAVAVDHNGDVVAGGTLGEPQDASSFALLKFKGTTGAELWRKTVPGVANSFLEARAIELDFTGNAFVSGVVEDAENLSAFLIGRFDGQTGNPVWLTSIVGTTPFFHRGHAVSLSSEGAIVATGITQNKPTSADFTLVKLDGNTGVEDAAWRQVITGNTSRTNRDDAARAMAVSAGGATVVAGHTENTGGGLSGEIQDFFLVKIDRNGKERCRFAITDPVHLSDDALAVAFDQYGNMVAAGRTGTVRASSQFTVLKTNRQCNLVWRASIPGTASGHGEARRVAVDAEGNVIAAGFVPAAGSSQDAKVIKIAPEGNVLWEMSGPGLSTFHQDTINALVVMENHDIVVAGALSGHFAMLRLDAATGAVLPGWPLLLGSGMATAAVADSHSNLIAGGFLSGALFSTDMLVVKISPDGHLIWQTTAVGTSSMVRSDQVNALAVTRTDDIAAAGVLTNTGTSADAALVLLDAQTGSERWRQLVNGNLNIADAATSVATHRDGTLVMGAQLRERNANALFTLVAFHANGTERWRRLIPGTLPDINDSAVAVALTHRGRRLVAAGIVSNVETFRDIALVHVWTNDGSDIDLPSAVARDQEQED
jgi:outer membrane protein assembly factor BamB